MVLGFRACLVYKAYRVLDFGLIGLMQDLGFKGLSVLGFML